MGQSHLLGSIWGLEGVTFLWPSMYQNGTAMVAKGGLEGVYRASTGGLQGVYRGSPSCGRRCGPTGRPWWLKGV
eukprot:4068130-Pyramimonas_sp.AAC.1